MVDPAIPDASSSTENSVMLPSHIGCCCCCIDASTWPPAASGDATGTGLQNHRAPVDYDVGAPDIPDVASPTVDYDYDDSSSGDLWRPPW